MSSHAVEPWGCSWLLGFLDPWILTPQDTCLPGESYPIGLYRPPRKNSTVGQMITGLRANPVIEV
jgi:hypothetical protein